MHEKADCSLLPTTQKKNVLKHVVVPILIVLFAIDVAYSRKKTKCPSYGKEVTSTTKLVAVLTGFFGFITFALFLLILYFIEREHLHHLADTRPCAYSKPGSFVQRISGPEAITVWTKTIIAFKVIILIFMFGGLFVIPLHTMYTCGILPMAAGRNLLTCKKKGATSSKGSLNPTSTLTGYAAKADKIVRYMMAVWLSFIWLAITVQMIRTEDVVMKSYLQLGLIGISIALFAAISSAMTVDDVQQSAEVAYSI